MLGRPLWRESILRILGSDPSCATMSVTAKSSILRADYKSSFNGAQGRSFSRDHNLVVENPIKSP